MVEGDGCCETEEALQDALSESWEGACAVALEGEDVSAGPEDALDALADRREVGSTSGLVFASGSGDRGVQVADADSELPAGVALIADQRHFALAGAALEEFERDVALVLLGGGQGECSGVPSGAKMACSLNPQKNREWLAQYP